jgi:predicted O-methyltransferase YrrM
LPSVQGIVSNVRAAIGSPRDWWLARQSVVHHGAIQHVDELAEFAGIVRKMQPRSVLEIGTAQGGVFWLFCKISAPDATLISLDLPPSDRHSGGQPVFVDLDRMKKSGQRVKKVLGDSHDLATLQNVRSILAGQPLDLLLIDGDHTYAGVRRDYEMYGALVRSGGIIAFHDIIQTDWEGCKVDLLWHELQHDALLETRSIVRPYQSTFGGIGLLTVGSLS